MKMCLAQNGFGSCERLPAPSSFLCSLLYRRGDGPEASDVANFKPHVGKPCIR